MGTTTSSSSCSGSGVINLSRGTKVQAYLAAPQEQSTIGIIVLCDGASSFFDAPEMRRVVDYMALSSGSIVISADMLMSPTSPEATSADKIEVLFYFQKCVCVIFSVYVFIFLFFIFYILFFM